MHHTKKYAQAIRDLGIDVDNARALTTCIFKSA